MADRTPEEPTHEVLTPGSTSIETIASGTTAGLILGAAWQEGLGFVQVAPTRYPMVSNRCLLAVHGPLLVGTLVTLMMMTGASLFDIYEYVIYIEMADSLHCDYIVLVTTYLFLDIGCSSFSHYMCKLVRLNLSDS